MNAIEVLRKLPPEERAVLCMAIGEHLMEIVLHPDGRTKALASAGLWCDMARDMDAAVVQVIDRVMSLGVEPTASVAKAAGQSRRNIKDRGNAP